MARTKASRGATSFKLRSGNNLKTGTPYPFLRAITGGIGSKLTNLIRGKKNNDTMAEPTPPVQDGMVGVGNVENNSTESQDKVEAIKAIIGEEDSLS